MNGLRKSRLWLLPQVPRGPLCTPRREVCGPQPRTGQMARLGTGHEAASQPKQEPAAGFTAPGIGCAAATPNRRGPGQARCTCCLHTGPQNTDAPRSSWTRKEQVARQGVTRVALSTTQPSHSQGGGSPKVPRGLG